jgi:hypothetical protein
MSALSIREVADRLGIRPKAALKLVHSEAIRAINVAQPGKRAHFKVLQEDFDRFVETRTFHVAPPRRRRRRLTAPAKRYF